MGHDAAGVPAHELQKLEHHLHVVLFCINVVMQIPLCGVSIRILHGRLDCGSEFDVPISNGLLYDIFEGMKKRQQSLFFFDTN